MKAICVEDGLCVLQEDVEKPTPKPHEVLIKVHYTALNRADVFQKQGKYPPPPGASEILGLECSGEIVAIGSAVKEWQVGDLVCALLEGGGYAEYATCAATQCIRVPEGWDMREAGGVMEGLCTVWLALFETAKLQKGEVALIHGGASGIGSMAIQMVKAAGAVSVVTVGTQEKAAFCRSLGAELAIHYQEEVFQYVVKEAFPQGVNVVLDIVGGDYFQANLSVLAAYGRMVSLAFLSGAKAGVNMAPLLFKQASWHGLTLRSRTVQQKAALVQAVSEQCHEWLVSRQVVPVINAEYSLEEAEKAHITMQQNLNLGKILLKVAPDS